MALEAEFAVLDEDDESAVDTIRLADDYRVVQHDSTCGEAGMAHGQEVARTRQLQRHPCAFTYDGLQCVRGQCASSETTEHLDFERDKAKGAREALQEQGLECRMLETHRFHGVLLQCFSTQGAFVRRQVAPWESEQFCCCSRRGHGPVERQRPRGGVQVEKIVPVFPKLLDRTRERSGIDHPAVASLAFHKVEEGPYAQRVTCRAARLVVWLACPTAPGSAERIHPDR